MKHFICNWYCREDWSDGIGVIQVISFVLSKSKKYVLNMDGMEQKCTMLIFEILSQMRIRPRFEHLHRHTVGSVSENARRGFIFK